MGLVEKKSHTKTVITSACFRSLGWDPQITILFKFNDVSGTSRCLPAAPLSSGASQNCFLLAATVLWN